MTTIWAEQALTPEGWRPDVRVEIGDDGRIEKVTPSSPSRARRGKTTRVGILLPAPTNLHSHAFQRAMAGLTERRGPDPRDTFWTWRRLMFRFLDQLTPDQIEAITAFVQMEMLEAGYAASVEFHYLHHQPGGRPYDDLAELSGRIVAAADQTGIGLTLLPVLYEHGGCDGRPLGPGQVRFGNDAERFARLLEGAGKALARLPADARIGVAPHSLRAVSRESLAIAVGLQPSAPLHMHVAEQVAEVEEIVASWGARPAEWLFANHDIGTRWCFIHATQMKPFETRALARSGAVAGLCPITESSLGDGIFDGVNFLAAGGTFGVGSDSNIRIALAEELRTLEYSQRLRDKGRAMLATPEASTGRVLYEGVCRGGARAAARDSGVLAPGNYADLLALDAKAVDLEGKRGDTLLDSYIFAGDDRMVADVWSAGRHVVVAGRHIARDAIIARYRAAVATLTSAI
ncbi:MAG: formimidoylglutamate deiminase [Rhizobiales bacterium]|nr:formimidoylglutamate deiminase [Hyphomicrobiales bacterium]